MNGETFKFKYKACPRCGWILGRYDEVFGRHTPTKVHWRHLAPNNPCSNRLRAAARKRAVSPWLDQALNEGDGVYRP